MLDRQVAHSFLLPLPPHLYWELFFFILPLGPGMYHHAHYHRIGLVAAEFYLGTVVLKCKHADMFLMFLSKLVRRRK
jgi:hypothetical protein